MKEYESEVKTARNPNTSSQTLEKLASDKDWFIRSCVAENPNTSSETLEKLANDEDSYVYDCVTKNPNTPEYIKFYLYFNHA